MVTAFSMALNPRFGNVDSSYSDDLKAVSGIITRVNPFSLAYGSSLQLLTDYYQLTMAYASWKAKRQETPAVFSLYFRSNPFHGGYTVATGLQPACELMENFRFTGEDIAFLAELKNQAGNALFEKSFLSFLQTSRFRCDLDAVPEGTIVFPHEPIVRVRGPLWQCQWIESALLNIINFQSLVATKASRMVQAAKGAEVIEMGLRRAQGIDGALGAARASFIGGTSATSNLLAARQFGIPLRGTQAHSWVMSFDSELEAFERYAEAFPADCVLLLDTYDTEVGIENAITVGKKLKAQGQDLVGVRLDSGDFAYLSRLARERLDRAGLTRTKTVASNELDEHLIQSLHLQEAQIDVWGVGTKLITAQDQPAMSGVYKLVAIYDGKYWVPKIKISDQPAKISNPGIPRVRRYFNAQGGMEGDLIYDESEKPTLIRQIFDPVMPHRQKLIQKDWTSSELMEPIFSQGQLVYSHPSMNEIREKVKTGMQKLHPGHKRFENPHSYPVGLSPYLSQLKQDLVRKSQGQS